MLVSTLLGPYVSALRRLWDTKLDSTLEPNLGIPLCLNRTPRRCDIKLTYSVIKSQS